MSSTKLTSRNVVPAKRPPVDTAQAPSRAPARPTQPITDAQRNVLLKNMCETSSARPAPAHDDDDLEMEIAVVSEEAAAPAKKATSTNAHVARRQPK